MRTLASALLDLVYAPICLGCDGLISAGDAERLVCRGCRTRLRVPPLPCCARCGAPLRDTGRPPRAYGCDECADWPYMLHSARAAYLLEPPADRLVHQLKYRGWRALAPVLAERMSALEWPDDAHEPAVLVPVATTPARLRERGYNQAAALAEAVGALTDRRVASLLRRASAARTQTALQPAARAANVAGAFSADGAADLHIILVDDVLTTGATAAECARALAAAGACCVRLLTFARAFEIRGPTT